MYSFLGKRKEPECRHDWEVVDATGDLETIKKDLEDRGYAVAYDRSFYLGHRFREYCYFTMTKDGHTARGTLEEPRVDILHKKVCLKCHRCWDGVTRSVEELERQWAADREYSKQQRQRKQMAKDLWNDNCKEG